MFYERKPRKFRTDDTWREVRRAWERGETGASLAQRYDVGLSNLWRRRAAEAWVRDEEEDPPAEPLEGWDRYAQRKMDEFELRREETRVVAQKLVEAMTGGTLEGVPLWHVGFVLTWRAERMGPETAARDRDYMARHDWAGVLWDPQGRLWPVRDLDAMTVDANPEAWREDAGLPPGAAQGWP